MAKKSCRLCQTMVPSAHAVCLFSIKADKARLRSRISDLLDIPVTEKDGLPEHICEKCRRKLERLEKAAEDLVDFWHQAKSACTVLFGQGRQLKRRKETSSMLGVSPDTARNRPPSKKPLPRRQLEYDDRKQFVTSMHAPCRLYTSFLPVHS